MNLDAWKPLHHLLERRWRGISLGVFLAAGAVTGLACVAFMRAFEFVLQHRLDADRVGMWYWFTTPALFVLAVELIRRTAPCADGAGIPQAIFAATHLNETSIRRLHPLVSIRTMVVKVVALLLGVWAGASTGREGPTVHVAACLFLGVLLLVQRATKLKLDLRSGVIAGGAAGLATAFNTPLAGVTFAIEELSADYFSSIKESVLMAIIVAGIAAKSLTGGVRLLWPIGQPDPGLCQHGAGDWAHRRRLRSRVFNGARQRSAAGAGFSAGLVAIRHSRALRAGALGAQQPQLH